MKPASIIIVIIALFIIGIAYEFYSSQSQTVWLCGTAEAADNHWTETVIIGTTTQVILDCTMASDAAPVITRTVYYNPT